ncbi:MAG: hypothetical protein K9J37_08450 [Saprospiraceae bacterium]|nr:hypothetical protein [Saprospiraceae bacterium]MCF8249929.1 hypothetical protein [Saprospiraceae bacterium]MCF8279342.1 hypothetical protein [Bacteroidales bacterium]MCF8310033.1 hypothetical protein [Saprospiraceae bacterium]MCF8438933.1 hypothetical protein [Saprospiraceae bacterium]
MANRKAPISDVDNSVLVRTVIIAGAILTSIFIGLLFFQEKLAGLFGRYADEATIGLMLLGLWLVVSTTVRSVNNLAKGIQAWKLLLGGVMVGFVASLLTTAFLIVFPVVAKSQNMEEVTGATGAMILVMSVIALLIALITTINVRVKSRQLGNLLEVLIIGGVIAGLVWWATR